MKLLIERSTLDNIGYAIREKGGANDLIPVPELANSILNIPTGGGELPEEALNITGQCDYRFAYGGWDWFINTYGNRITTNNITSANRMFDSNSTIEEVPFKININSNYTNQYLFYNCYKLKNIGGLSLTGGWQYTFQGCYLLRELPEDIYFDASNATDTGGNFNNCYSIRRIPTAVLKELRNPKNTYPSSWGGPYDSTFYGCYALDEIIGMSLDCGSETATITSNLFSNYFLFRCGRLKEFQFQLNDDGTPKVRNWKNQVIDFTYNVGYAYQAGHITNYNSGITADKRVTDEATYNALKNDPDYWTTSLWYSRYNHDSAVNTINSLPDCSSSGGTNTIKFQGQSGTSTDGGAINTLAEAEIAVATAKSWTVSFV